MKKKNHTIKSFHIQVYIRENFSFICEEKKTLPLIIRRVSDDKSG